MGRTSWALTAVYEACPPPSMTPAPTRDHSLRWQQLVSLMLELRAAQATVPSELGELADQSGGDDWGWCYVETNERSHQEMNE